MSEEQADYDTDAGPTPGPWRIPELNPYAVMTHFDEDGSHRSICSMIHGLHGVDSDDEKEANAELIAAAGTAAQEARELGYDPVAAVEALPDLLAVLQDIDGMIEQLKYGTIRMMVEDALASAEGSDDE